MKEISINKEIILLKIDLINKSIIKLNKLKSLKQGDFSRGDNFAIAEHYLRYALEATFDICAHILSRIPGVMIDEYKKMALEMAKQKIIPTVFAEEKLVKMAGYRNRLTHVYFEVTSQEIYNILRNDLGDFDVFAGYIKKYCKL